jgi:hypothetical protein
VVKKLLIFSVNLLIDMDFMVYMYGSPNASSLGEAICGGGCQMDVGASPVQPESPPMTTIEG